MTGPTGTNEYPKPEPQRVERALAAMHARRAKLRRVRAAGVVTSLVVIAVAVAIAVAASSPSGRHLVRVAGPETTTTIAAESTTVTSTRVTTTSGVATTTSTVTTPSSVPGTQQITYQPFTASGDIDPNLRVTSTGVGTCLTGESSRSYRCFSDPPGAIYDPCFASPRGTAQPLVCPKDPSTADVVELTVTSLPSLPPVKMTGPWAMQLSGGRVCLFVAAAWSGLGPFDCHTGASSSAPPADCRVSQPQQPWWTVECQDQQTQTSPFTARRVTKVWF